MSVQNTDDGIRAVQKGKPIDSGSVERYLRGKFGDDLKSARTEMERLAKAYKVKELVEEAYSLYEAFRHEIPSGKSGWGAKGDLDLELIESLGKKKRHHIAHK